MVAYHFGFTLIIFGYLPMEAVKNPLLNLLEPIFAGVFILLCGVSSNFSRSNIRRGLITLVCAAAVSFAMWFIKMPVWFGILHLLGVCMLLYGLIGKYVAKVSGFIWLGLFVVCYIVFPTAASDIQWFAWLGIGGDFSYSTSDYFPLLKWVFLFLAGSRLGPIIKARRLPNWFYSFNMPVLPEVGRHTLIIYMVHQPALYGALKLVEVIRNG
ncbi:hypothetical protein FACS1894217_14810 [Clostridia bacterium]|nr:hypothetical protein FACS1894217_14810 [Clostridia bacterium]